VYDRHIRYRSYWRNIATKPLLNHHVDLLDGLNVGSFSCYCQVTDFHARCIFMRTHALSIQASVFQLAIPEWRLPNAIGQGMEK
jgi:hypothetical protein